MFDRSVEPSAEWKAFYNWERAEVRSALSNTISYLKRAVSIGSRL